MHEDPDTDADEVAEEAFDGEVVVAPARPEGLSRRRAKSEVDVDLENAAQGSQHPHLAQQEHTEGQDAVFEIGTQCAVSAV